jgi:hypothetical protein
MVCKKWGRWVYEYPEIFSSEIGDFRVSCISRELLEIWMTLNGRRYNDLPQRTNKKGWGVAVEWERWFAVMLMVKLLPGKHFGMEEKVWTMRCTVAWWGKQMKKEGCCLIGKEVGGCCCRDGEDGRRGMERLV